MNLNIPKSKNLKSRKNLLKSMAQLFTK